MTARHRTTSASGGQSDRSVKVLALSSALAAGLMLAASAVAQSAPALLPIVTRLRSADIKPEEGFSGVVGAAFLPNGSIVVGDAGRRAILRFDAVGRYVGSFGRQGKGPGEFEDLAWLGSCADGSVIAFDGANRVSTFDRAGRFVKVFVPPTWFIFDKLLSCADAESAVFLQDMPRSNPSLRGRAITYPAIVASAKWVAPSIDTLAVLSGTEYYFAKARGFVDLPLGDRAMASAAGGLIAAGVSGSEKVLFLREDGGHVDTLRVAGARARVSDTDWQRAKTERLATEFNAETRLMLQGLLREAVAPTLLPLYDALLVDRFTSGVWARLYARTDRAEWRRLNPAPRARARFLLPTDVQVLGISRTQLLGLRRQADGTEELILYAFAR